MIYIDFNDRNNKRIKIDDTYKVKADYYCYRENWWIWYTLISMIEIIYALKLTIREVCGSEVRYCYRQTSKSMHLICIDFIDRKNKRIKIDDPFFLKQNQRKSYKFFLIFFYHSDFFLPFRFFFFETKSKKIIKIFRKFFDSVYLFWNKSKENHSYMEHCFHDIFWNNQLSTYYNWR